MITIQSWQKTNDGCVCLAVFDNPESVIGFLTALKKEDLGLSVVVSGLMDQVKECCDHAGLKVHTINLSLGTFGKTEKMAGSREREITHVRHGMITGDLVLYHVDRIAKALKPQSRLPTRCVNYASAEHLTLQEAPSFFRPWQTIPDLEEKRTVSSAASPLFLRPAPTSGILFSYPFCGTARRGPALSARRFL